MNLKKMSRAWAGFSLALGALAALVSAPARADDAAVAAASRPFGSYTLKTARLRVALPMLSERGTYISPNGALTADQRFNEPQRSCQVQPRRPAKDGAPGGPAGELPAMEKPAAVVANSGEKNSYWSFSFELGDGPVARIECVWLGALSEADLRALLAPYFDITTVPAQLQWSRETMEARLVEVNQSPNVRNPGASSRSLGQQSGRPDPVIPGAGEAAPDAGIPSRRAGSGR